jgi:hypothetical protein
VLAYRSPLPFSLQGDRVVAIARFQPLDAYSSPLTGELVLTRKDSATLQGANSTLADRAGNSFPFVVAGDFMRDGGSYFGIVVFDDFLAATPTADYRFWIAEIVDPGDSDADGIPDIADADFVAVSAPFPPRITLWRNGELLKATVSGTPGQLVHLERTSALETAAWNPVQGFLIGKGPRFLELGLAEGRSGFWRLVLD